LTLGSIEVRPDAPPKRDRLKFRTTIDGGLAGVNPMHEDTSLQISDDHGQVFCTTVNAMHFMPKGKRTVMFWGDGSVAHGLSDRPFRTSRNGRVTFRTHGANAQVRASDSRSLRITLRVGQQCAHASTGVRAKKTAIVFP